MSINEDKKYIPFNYAVTENITTKTSSFKNKISIMKKQVLLFKY